MSISDAAVVMCVSIITITHIICILKLIDKIDNMRNIETQGHDVTISRKNRQISAGDIPPDIVAPQIKNPPRPKGGFGKKV